MNIDDRDARQPVAATESTVGRQCRLGGGTELACRIDAIETIPALPAGYRVLVHHWIAVWVVVLFTKRHVKSFFYNNNNKGRLSE